MIRSEVAKSKEELRVRRALAAIPRWKRKRDAIIAGRVEAGETYEQVAVDYSLSKERIRQICEAHKAAMSTAAGE